MHKVNCSHLIFAKMIVSSDKSMQISGETGRGPQIKKCFIVKILPFHKKITVSSITKFVFFWAWASVSPLGFLLLNQTGSADSVWPKGPSKNTVNLHLSLFEVARFTSKRVHVAKQIIETSFHLQIHNCLLININANFFGRTMSVTYVDMSIKCSKSGQNFSRIWRKKNSTILSALEPSPSPVQIHSLKMQDIRISMAGASVCLSLFLQIAPTEKLTTQS